MTRLAALALVMLGALPAGAQQVGVPQLPPDAPVELLVDGLLLDVEAYGARCRGGSGDDPETFAACGARDYAGYLLGQLGWCLGREGQVGAEEAWHPCEAGSTRIGRPPS